MGSLYLDIGAPINLSSNVTTGNCETEYFSCNVSTAIVAFVLEYCQYWDKINVIFIRRQCLICDSSGTDDSCQTPCASGREAFILDLCYCKPMIQSIVAASDLNYSCKSPFLVLPACHLVHCGLANILRHIVTLAANHSEGGGHCEGLLGYKERCLKACSQVSAWTRFCEVDLPNAIQEWPEELVTIPVELLRVEKHISSPLIVPSLKKKKNKNKNENENKMNGWHGVEPGMKSSTDISIETTQGGLGDVTANFIEGGPFATLVDVVLFPCFTLFLTEWKGLPRVLSQKLPRMLRWYQRMSGISHFSQALNWCKISAVDVKHLLISKNLRSHCDIGSEIDICSDLIKMLNVRHATKKKFEVDPNLLQQAIEKCSTINQPLSNDELLLSADNVISDNRICSVVNDGCTELYEGCLPRHRVDRKRQQLLSMTQAVRRVVTSGDVIVDFCSGAGHLGILLAQTFPSCQIYLVESKLESVAKALDAVKDLNLKNVTIYHSNLDYFGEDFDVGVCLHGCGSITDLVLRRCLRTGASFVLCPCCYGATDGAKCAMEYPQSNTFCNENVTREDFQRLCHAADQTEAGTSQYETGRLCMDLVDSDRCCLSKEGAGGYSAILTRLHPATCSPKNNVLIGSSARKGRGFNNGTEALAANRKDS